MADRGFICMAQNNSTTDYLRLAYLQCLSCKLTNPDIPYAVVTDSVSAKTLTPKMREAFDYVIELKIDIAEDQEWKQRNDWQLFKLSPFTETIKLEADLLLTRSIAHWWCMLEHKDVVLSLGCRDYKGNVASSRAYRQIFDSNHLPDIYSGLMYWRKSELANYFFNTCGNIYLNWDEVSKTLIRCDDPGSNDIVFALAAQIVGSDLVTLPAADFFNFTHMKSAINGIPESWKWTVEHHVEVAPPNIRVGGYEQWYPFHYHTKDWATDKLIELYERAR